MKKIIQKAWKIISIVLFVCAMSYLLYNWFEYLDKFEDKESDLRKEYWDQVTLSTYLAHKYGNISSYAGGNGNMKYIKDEKTFYITCSLSTIEDVSYQYCIEGEALFDENGYLEKWINISYEGGPTGGRTL